MKKILFTVMALALSLPSWCKTMGELWASMPDSILPYLSHETRMQMPTLASMPVDGHVDNLLGGKSRMDTLTANYTQVTLSEATTLQLRLMPTFSADSIICMVKTYKQGQGESEVVFFTQDWQPLSTREHLGSNSIADFAGRLLQKPDTMNAATYATLKEKFDPVMVHASLSAADDTLTIALSPVLLSEDDQAEVSALLTKKTLVWRDGKFNF